MNTLENFAELARAVRDLIRIGVVSEIDTEQGLCRVQTGELMTDWLHWLTPRAGAARTWWAPSVGEQVLILSLGGELDTAFVLPAIYSDDFPAPNVTVTVSEQITLDTPEVVCTNKLTGNISHSGGSLTSNGIALHTHKYGGVQTGGGQTQGPQ
jgi:phage baseplate assembly protein gpV